MTDRTLTVDARVSRLFNPFSRPFDEADAFELLKIGLAMSWATDFVGFYNEQGDATQLFWCYVIIDGMICLGALASRWKWLAGLVFIGNLVNGIDYLAGDSLLPIIGFLQLLFSLPILKFIIGPARS